MFLTRRGPKFVVALRRAELLLLGVLAVHCGSKSQYDDDDSTGGAKNETGGSSAKGGSAGTKTQPGTSGDGGAAGQSPGAGGDAGAENGGVGNGDAGGNGPRAATGGGGSGGTSEANGGKGGSTGGKGGTSGNAGGKGGSGAAAGSGAGGSAGGAVDPFAGCTLAPVAQAPTVTLLDDFEDGDTYAQGYGSWYPFDDGTAAPGDEATLATSASTRSSGNLTSLEFTTGVHSDFGSGFGVILHDDGGTQTPEDAATSYDGLELWARAASPGSVRVNFPDVNSDPLGGVCSEDDGTCFHYYGVDLDLDTTWRLYRIQWDEVYVASSVEPFDPHSIYRVEFAVDPAAGLDMSIDDANFFRYATNAYNVSGREFRKAHAHRVFHGVDRPSLEWSSIGDHLSRADLELMAGWGADTVRIALNQDFWLPASPAYDAGYAPLVDKMVACAHSADLDVILDLHWSDQGNYSVTPGQQQMADAHSVAFWQDVATRYKNNSRVLFELYNEPHDVSWSVWRDGGAATGFTAAGYQDLYDAVRGTGAENVVLAGGLSYAFDLSGLPAYKIRGFNVGYVTHPYNFPGKQPADWPDAFGTAATEFPVIATEFGDTMSCSASYTQSLIDYAASLDISWTAWAWFVADTNPCAFPTIISAWDGTPTTAGAAVKAALSP